MMRRNRQRAAGSRRNRFRVAGVKTFPPDVCLLLVGVHRHLSVKSVKVIYGAWRVHTLLHAGAVGPYSVTPEAWEEIPAAAD